ncbi:TniQ family protein [Streptomyces sp. NPDC008238]
MMLDSPRLWGPHFRLAIPVRHVPGESTGSFVNRLAHSNGLQLGELLDRVGQGRTAVDPRYAEMYVNQAGLEYLAVLAGRPAAALQRALPSLTRERILPGDGPARWHWPWEPTDGYLVRGCDLCAAARGAREPVWLMCPDNWHICVRHRRWTDDARGDTAGLVRLDKLLEVTDAHRRRLMRRRRFGAAAEGLFADAYQIAGHWWSGAPGTSVWHQRATAAGLDPLEVRAAPLVFYPEAVFVAGALVDYERRLAAGGDCASILAILGSALERWGLDGARAMSPLREWVSRHHQPAPRSGGSRRRPLLTLGPGHQRSAGMAGSLAERSCLPWQLGLGAPE